MEVKSEKELKVDFRALARHGYSSGPSILHLPPDSTSTGNENWNWSQGKRKSENDEEEEESFEERQKTREVVESKATEVGNCIQMFIFALQSFSNIFSFMV